MGASSDTPSSLQVQDVLTELRGIARTLERIRFQLQRAGFIALLLIIYGGVLAVILSATNAGR